MYNSVLIERQVIEIFHLLFLLAFGARVDKALQLISAPDPAYISLQSALFHHGLIEQIPSILYAVTPGRPRRLRTPIARVFSTLPELTIPRRFQWQRLREYTQLVKSPGRRAFISDRIKAIRSNASNSG
jgi:hypothetical protein